MLEENNYTNIKPHSNVMDLFQNQEIVKICAPMVRYSKLQFRNLVKLYKCDLCFTPMILADSFCKSAKARSNEFTTNFNDSPVITQFAANTVHDFVGATHMVSPYCDGVDLNCGCPQRWAKQQGLGCIMLEKPELIYDLVRETRNRISKQFTVSVKMRLKKDIKKSVEICRQLENCGVSFLTVHGRTPDQLTGEVNVQALKLIVENVGIPVVANGGVKNWDDCLNLKKSTNCRGVMVANGLLSNPTLFTNSATTTRECIQNWVNLCYNSTLQNDENPLNISEKPLNLTFQCFHHHLVFMLEKILNRSEKRIFNNLQTFAQVLDFLKNKFDISPQLFDEANFRKYKILHLDYTNRDEVYSSLKPDGLEYTGCDILYDYNKEGKYYRSKIQEVEECDWSVIFVENE